MHLQHIASKKSIWTWVAEHREEIDISIRKARGVDRATGRNYRCKADRTDLVLPFSPFDIFVCPDCTEDYLMEKVRKYTLNDSERAVWVNNDEGLYDMQRRSGLSMRAFIKKNRSLLDEYILNVFEGKKPVHYLKYGD